MQEKPKQAHWVILIDECWLSRFWNNKKFNSWTKSSFSSLTSIHPLFKVSLFVSIPLLLQLVTYNWCCIYGYMKRQQIDENGSFHILNKISILKLSYALKYDV